MADSSDLENPLDQLRLSVMQDVLPVGLAMLERARQGGPSKVAEVFTAGSDDPLSDLRQEGEPAARSVRQQLDQVSPGLGNPVVSVNVSVEPPTDGSEEQDRVVLLETLHRIEGRLAQLRGHLQSTGSVQATTDD
ncbi:MAG: hypothetical protein CL862_01705 [Cyanobium sp. NAT70]|mgnify:FL=1|nr:hypothetical protein [Cyanobium sp. NAT70]